MHGNHTSRKSEKRSNRSGFTLTEVLVVMAIMGLVALLIIPVITQTLAQARSTRSLSQMRQIGQVMQLYAQDNQQCWPAVAVSNPGQPWCRLPLDPYLPRTGNSENPIFICPNAEVDGLPNTKIRRSYSAGGAMFGLIGRSAVNTVKPRNVMTVNNPERAVLIFNGVVKSNGLARDGVNWTAFSLDLERCSATDNDRIDYRQNGSAHFMFADYHIESYTPEMALEAFPDHGVYEGI